MRRMAGAAVATAALLVAVACRVDFGWTMLPAAPSSLGAPFETIAVGRPFSGTIFGVDPSCTLPDGRFGPCRRLRLVAPLAGLLRVSISWDGGREILAFALVNRTVCCGSPLVAACDAFAGATYDIVVVLIDPQGGHVPRSTSQSFVLVAAIE